MDRNGKELVSALASEVAASANGPEDACAITKTLFRVKLAGDETLVQRPSQEALAKALGGERGIIDGSDETNTRAENVAVRYPNHKHEEMHIAPAEGALAILGDDVAWLEACLASTTPSV